MKIKLLRQTAITHKAGETVDVSPARAALLIAAGAAEEVKTTAKTPKKSAV